MALESSSTMAESGQSELISHDDKVEHLGDPDKSDVEFQARVKRYLSPEFRQQLIEHFFRAKRNALAERQE
jgi:hypothetical protein